MAPSGARVALAALLCAAAAVAARAEYLVGIGKADVTGPAADVNLMGYANINQTAKGIHTRLYARAFVFAEAERPSRRFLLVNVDAAMVSQLLTIKVVERLGELYGGQYTADNVALTATHTHASPGGFLSHLLYHITSLGFVQESFDAMADGIVEAASMAHGDLRPAELSWSAGELLGANINRSPTAYAANPEAERALYRHDVDKEMTVLRIKAPAGGGGGARGRALLSWFPVHCTSMNNTNELLSGDNKGAAELFVEKRWAPRQPGLEPGFVAAFLNSNAADTSPNTQGTFCLDTGLPCDAATSTCNGNNHLCVGRGPAYPDDTRSTEIIGQKQADKAQELWSAPGTAISGSVDYRHVFINISHMEVAESEFTRAGRTCPGAMGYSFAAGTTDGPGVNGFFQGDTHRGPAPAAPLVLAVNAALHSSPSLAQRECQGAKPILLNVGEAPKPYPWVPNVSEVSLLRLGNFVVVFGPGEFTTMAGRRMVAAVREAVRGAWGPGIRVVLSGYTNTYDSYHSTAEEYGVQRYEGASTLYGPRTLDAYVQTAVALARSMVEVDGRPAGGVPGAAAAPERFEGRLLRLLPPVLLDTAPPGAAFGQAVRQPRAAPAAYAPGEVVEASFVSASPRNDPRRGRTFLEVQRRNPASGAWVVVATDEDWETKVRWSRPKGGLPSESVATVLWQVPTGTAAGTHRIVHFGDWKALGGKLLSFVGVSGEFAVAGDG